MLQSHAACTSLNNQHGHMQDGGEGTILLDVLSGL